MKIVMLDRNSIGLDIDISMFENLGEFTFYNTLDPEQTKEKIKEATVIIFNKTVMNENLLKDAKNVKLLCVTATGIDNIDLQYAKQRNIVVTNVKNYSTPAVTQHTFALALYVIEKLRYYDNYVRTGKYCKELGFSDFNQTYAELEGKTWGIIGLGNIGKSVAKVAMAFGCRIIYYSTSGSNNSSEFNRVELETLLKESDIISIHCPLTAKTRGLMDKKAFDLMKRTAILINVSRGAVVNEQDLCEALNQDLIGGAGLDVLTKEPMEEINPLRNIKNSNKIIITPHMAWASIEARSRCMNEVYKNIQGFQAGIEKNVV